MFMQGKKAKDIITGFEGIITGKATYITGCDQYLLQPECKDGNFVEPRWFDEGRLNISDEFAINPESLQSEKPGGPKDLAPIK